MRALVVGLVVSGALALGCKDVEAEKKRQADATKAFMEAEAKARSEKEAADKQKALDEATAQCNGGDAAGCTALGRIHKTGPEAQAAFAKACGMKSKDGCRLAAEGEADDAKKLGHIKALCGLDDVDACVQGAALADALVQQGKLPEPKKMADREAIMLLKRACDLGGAIACTARGVALVNDDPKAALASFMKGCDANEPTACYQASVMLAEGKGVKKKDAAKAAALKKKACEAGLKDAC